MKHIIFILLAAVYACVPDTAAAKPNILFILADDLGQHQIGCFNKDRFYETPHIDGLAREGMRFTNAYAAAPVCSPTRASVLTGKYPARLHLTDYIPGEDGERRKLRVPRWRKMLPLEEVTLAENLRDAGYVTGHFGKWHLNADKDYELGRPGDPGSQGFDDVFTTVKPRSTDDPEKDPHHVREITRRAIEFIEANRGTPFFAYVSHNTIHNPLLAPSGLAQKYTAKPEADEGAHLPVVGAMIEELDRSVGDLIAAIDRLDLTDNTILVFFSDNGALQGRDVAKPLRRGKGDLYEGGIRVPLIVRWPTTVTAGTVMDIPVMSIDFMPTFLDAAGIQFSDLDLDGVSLIPLLRGADNVEREAIFWHYPHYHSAGLGPAGAVRMGRWKLIDWFEKEAFELYDLRNDPGERNDLSIEYPEQVTLLRERLWHWREAVGAQVMEPVL